MTGAEALMSAIADLRKAGVYSPARDARRIMAWAMGIESWRLTLVAPDPMSADALVRFRDGVAQRCARRPVSQITGSRAFYGRDFHVTADVLDPRPETETLVGLALAEPFSRVLDLGTGSGCILISLLAEREDATGLGVELSEAAGAVARGNAEALGVAARCEIVQGDWFAPVEGQFDLIVSNPPYIAAVEMEELEPEVRDWEPRGALTDEGDGLAAYRAISAQAGHALLPGGRIFLEIGPSQGAPVSAMLAEAGFEAVEVVQDLDGRDRVVCARQSLTLS